MHRFIFRAVSTARNSSSVGFFESRLLSDKCVKATAPVFSGTADQTDYDRNQKAKTLSSRTLSNMVNVTNGAKSLSTSSVTLCEKKGDVATSIQDETTDVGKGADPTLLEQKAESDQVIKMEVRRQEPAVLKTESAGVKTENKTMEVTTDAVKSGKESLLDLLGAMKVDVTNKRRLKNLKVNKSFSAPKSKPADMETTISMFQKATAGASSHSHTELDPELVAAASAAASTLPNASQAESELLKQLRQHEAVTEAQRKGDMNNLGSIIADMKVGRGPTRQNARPANQIQFDDDRRGYMYERGITAELDGVRRRRSLFSGKRLNIFSPVTDEDGATTTVAPPTLWDMEFATKLSSVTNQMPRNGLEEMIQWTKEGRMWQYPVNNEAGLEEEASVPFHEHIFLEKHLEEGFPRQGPVRHFMELVVNGLSRNPYLTVQQKKEHISWFRDYFHQKQDVLKEADIYLN